MLGLEESGLLPKPNSIEGGKTIHCIQYIFYTVHSTLQSYYRLQYILQTIQYILHITIHYILYTISPPSILNLGFGFGELAMRRRSESQRFEPSTRRVKGIPATGCSGWPVPSWSSSTYSPNPLQLKAGKHCLKTLYAKKKLSTEYNV